MAHDKYTKEQCYQDWKSQKYDTLKEIGQVRGVPLPTLSKWRKNDDWEGRLRREIEEGTQEITNKEEQPSIAVVETKEEKDIIQEDKKDVQGMAEKPAEHIHSSPSMPSTAPIDAEATLRDRAFRAAEKVAAGAILRMGKKMEAGDISIKDGKDMMAAVERAVKIIKAAHGDPDVVTRVEVQHINDYNKDVMLNCVAVGLLRAVKAGEISEEQLHGIREHVGAVYAAAVGDSRFALEIGDVRR